MRRKSDAARLFLVTAAVLVPLIFAIPAQARGSSETPGKSAASEYAGAAASDAAAGLPGLTSTSVETGTLTRRAVRLLVLDPDAPADLWSSAIQLSELLVVRLVNSDMFSLVEPEILRAELKHQKLLPAVLEDADMARRVCAAVGADYVITQRYAAGAGAHRWSVTMTSAQTGELVLSTAWDMEDGKTRETVERASSEILRLGMAVRFVELADIEVMAGAGEIDRARELLALYQELNPETPAVAELNERLTTMAAEAAFDRTGDFAALGLYRDAYLELSRALALRPESDEYRQYAVELERREREHYIATAKTRLKLADSLVERGHYRSARDILLSLADADAVPELIEAKRELDRKIEGIELLESAADAYWSGDTIAARSRAEDALRLVPGDRRALDVIDRLDREDAQRLRNDAVLEEYRDRLDYVTVHGLFLEAVESAPRWTIEAGKGAFAYRTAETLSNQEFPQLVLSGRYRRPYQVPWLTRTSAVRSFWSWNAGITVRVGGSEVAGSVDAITGFRRLERERFMSTGPVGGASFEIWAFSFQLSAGPELGLTATMYEDLERDPAADIDSRTRTVAVQPWINAAIALWWNVNDRDLIGFTAGLPLYASAWPVLNESWEKYRLPEARIGFSRRIP